MFTDNKWPSLAKSLFLMLILHRSGFRSCFYQSLMVQRGDLFSLSLFSTLCNKDDITPCRDGCEASVVVMCVKQWPVFGLLLTG